MSETWKGKTRGGTFGYMFFIYMIRCLGITAAYGSWHWSSSTSYLSHRKQRAILGVTHGTG